MEPVLKTTDNSTPPLKRPQLFKTGTPLKPEKSRFLKKFTVKPPNPDIFKRHVFRARIFPILGLSAVSTLLVVLVAHLYQLYTNFDELSPLPVQVSQTTNPASLPVNHPEKPATILDIDPVPEMFKTNTSAPAGHPISSEALTDSKTQRQRYIRYNSAAMVSKPKPAVKNSLKSRLPLQHDAEMTPQTATAVFARPVPDASVPTVNATSETALDADEEVLKAIIAHAEKSTSK